jgi:molybdopterin/thiamine biosynthesis adenylyltransferase
MTTPIELRIGEALHRSMNEHVLRDDSDEHGGALLCGISTSSRGTRLLARRFLPAEDGTDYIPGRRGYRELTATFIRRAHADAGEEHLVVLLVHGHGRGHRVDFSQTDNASHERGYPALRDIADQTVGALVLASHAIAGDIWHQDGSRRRLDTTVVIGSNITRVTPAPSERSSTRAEDDRQARLFGSAGQQILRRSRIGIVGVGGAGMLAVEFLSRLGVGELVVVDPDKVEITNLTRLPGALRRDACAILTHPSRPGWVRKLGSKLARRKVHVARRLARRAGQGTKVETYATDVRDAAAARALRDCDYIVLAADSATARHLINTISHQYLIPAIQVGVKIPISASGAVGDLFAVDRPVVPDLGCLRCSGLIDPTKLALESIPNPVHRKLADYGTGEPAPSVITLNGIAVSNALTKLTFALTGLNLDEPIAHHRTHPRRNYHALGEPARNSDCTVCGPRGAIGLGDLRPLPLPRN